MKLPGHSGGPRVGCSGLGITTFLLTSRHSVPELGEPSGLERRAQAQAEVVGAVLLEARGPLRVKGRLMMASGWVCRGFWRKVP